MEYFKPEYISAYSSLLLVFATIIYVAFTYKLFTETKKLREVETSPFLSLELSSFRFSMYLSLKIKNIGKAPAYNISFKCDEKFSDVFRFNFNTKIGYFAPEQEIEALGKTYKEFQELGVENIPIKVTYYSKDNLRYEEEFLLEWISLDGILLEENNLENIVTSLKKIESVILKQTKVLEKKNNIISRIAILEIEETAFYFKCLFNDGYYGKIEKRNICQLGIKDLSSIKLHESNLYESSTNLIFKAEEIYNKFKIIESKKITYKR